MVLIAVVYLKLLARVMTLKNILLYYIQNASVPDEKANLDSKVCILSECNEDEYLRSLL